jgi:hypothetical protein
MPGGIGGIWAALTAGAEAQPPNANIMLNSNPNRGFRTTSINFIAISVSTEYGNITVVYPSRIAVGAMQREQDKPPIVYREEQPCAVFCF